jgi:hypothetical protein
MSSRQSSDPTSSSGVSYASPTGTVVKGIELSQSTDAGTNSWLARHWPNPIQVWADGSVFDTVTGKFLLSGRDFQFTDLQRF